MDFFIFYLTEFFIFINKNRFLFFKKKKRIFYLRKISGRNKNHERDGKGNSRKG